MKFTSLPTSYSSYNEPLVYAFDTQAEASDVEVRVINATTSEVIGRKMLYGVSVGQVDIAPYVRRAAQVVMPEMIECSQMLATGVQVKVKVEVAGVISSSRNFIAARFDTMPHFALLTNQISRRTMARDEFDLIAYFAMPDAVVEVVVEATGKENQSLSLEASGGHRVIALTAASFDSATEDLKIRHTSSTLTTHGEVAATATAEVVTFF